MQKNEQHKPVTGTRIRYF